MSKIKKIAKIQIRNCIECPYKKGSVNLMRGYAYCRRIEKKYGKEYVVNALPDSGIDQNCPLEKDVVAMVGLDEAELEKRYQEMEAGYAQST